MGSHHSDLHFRKPGSPLSLRELKLMEGLGVSFQSLSQWMSEVP